MLKSNQKGFSLVELLVVVVVIGVISALAVPSLLRAKASAQNKSAFSAMRTISSTQVNYFSQNSRFGSLPELQVMLNNGLGTTAGNTVVRGPFTFELTTPVADLPNSYTITATRSGTSDVYKYAVTQAGVIEQILP